LLVITTLTYLYEDEVHIDGYRKMGTNTEHETVTLDNRGRITLPKHVRNRLQLDEGDDLDLDLENGEVHLRPDRPPFEPIASGKSEWGTETFMSAGEALFGNIEDNDGESSE
jgi:AbrB family looped-hinge helix DNA binding protein